ncbi:hypothetical protein CASFOL_038564 [Castilleja foliolosa]|uniref:Pectinesterase inhibitor domain-containing protein n=1 Tax=Castilleja foliolosa TaxID=1961234 RepID=A0ABD3BM20_9LAMI
MDTKFVFLLIVVLILQANNKACADIVNTDDLIGKWCSRTERKELCVKLIEADPRKELKSSPNGFCEIVRDKAVKVYVATNSKIPSIVNRTTVPFVRRCLIDECSEGYIQAIDHLKSLDFSVISRETYQNLAVSTSYGYTNPWDCEHCFKEGPPGLSIPPELASDNRNLENAPIIIADIINLVVCNKIEACQG